MNIHFNLMFTRNKMLVKWTTREAFPLKVNIKTQFSIQILQKKNNR
jgi:hypothetical protein